MGLHATPHATAVYDFIVSRVGYVWSAFGVCLFQTFFFQVAFCVYTHVGEEINMTE